MTPRDSSRALPRSQRWEVRQEQLLEVAAQLFAHHGLEGTTTRDIAREAGVSPGLLYHYYPSKEDLLLAVVGHLDPTTRIRELLEGHEERNAVEVLPRMMAGLSVLFGERRDLIWLLMRAAERFPAVAEALKRMEQEVATLLAGYLQARVQAGELRPHDSRRLALGMYRALAMEHLAEPAGQVETAAFAETVLFGLVPRG